MSFVGRINFPKLTLHRLTSCKRISFVIRITGTGKEVINNLALGILPANSGARVGAFVVHAGSILGAVCILDALWSTAKVGITSIFRQTSANSIATLGIWSAR